MADTGIVRNRAKIDATIANARAAAELGSSTDLSELLWSFAPATAAPGRRRLRNPFGHCGIEGHGA